LASLPLRLPSGAVYRLVKAGAEHHRGLDPAGRSCRKVAEWQHRQILRKGGDNAGVGNVARHLGVHHVGLDRDVLKAVLLEPGNRPGADVGLGLDAS
jgi:hypothetical protein